MLLVFSVLLGESGLAQTLGRQGIADRGAVVVVLATFGIAAKYVASQCSDRRAAHNWTRRLAPVRIRLSMDCRGSYTTGFV